MGNQQRPPGLRVQHTVGRVSLNPSLPEKADSEIPEKLSRFTNSGGNCEPGRPGTCSSLTPFAASGIRLDRSLHVLGELIGSGYAVCATFSQLQGKINSAASESENRDGPPAYRESCRQAVQAYMQRLRFSKQCKGNETADLKDGTVGASPPFGSCSSLPLLAGLMGSGCTVMTQNFQPPAGQFSGAGHSVEFSSPQSPDGLGGDRHRFPRSRLRDTFTSCWPKTTDAIQCPRPITSA